MLNFQLRYCAKAQVNIMLVKIPCICLGGQALDLSGSHQMALGKLEEWDAPYLAWIDTRRAKMYCNMILKYVQIYPPFSQSDTL